MQMICGYQELLSVLPGWLGKEIDRCGVDGLQEIRLRVGKGVELRGSGRSVFLQRIVKGEDISFCINTATRYSPWAYETMSEGFITAPGGHRIGVCGEAVGQPVRTMRNVRSLCIRVAGDFPGIGEELAKIKGSILIIGKPGSGKTTLLRDLIRQRSRRETVCVIDQRCELFPGCFETGPRVDVMSGCGKKEAVDMLLRTMGPDTIAMDEITLQSDCEAMLSAAWCGVELIATAHASDMKQLKARSVYRPLVESGVFQTVAVLQPDKSWRTERMGICT